MELKIKRISTTSHHFHKLQDILKIMIFGKILVIIIVFSF